ncbi:MAG: MRP family ATP-binding protein, partial [Ferruginibacter sp.]
DIPFLGEIPIVQSIREGGDSGIPIMAGSEILTKKAFIDFAGNAVRGIAMRNADLAPTEIQPVTEMA